MRTIVHLSDLHFGAEDHQVATTLIHTVERLAPDVIAVSGDLTQRARRAQFQRARAFLDALPGAKVVVPGNHDVPLYNVLLRFHSPLRGFRRYITADPHPQFTDSELAVLGANTTRSFTIKDGGLRAADVRRLSTAFDEIAASVVKVVVCHHPFDSPAGPPSSWTLPRSDATAVDTLVSHGVDIFLTGHLHLRYVGHTAARYNIKGRSAIVVEAGTATSHRVRGEKNSFNVLRIGPDAVVIEHLELDDRSHRFLVVRSESFARSDGGWTPTP